MAKRRLLWYFIGCWLAPLLFGLASLFRGAGKVMHRATEQLEKLDKTFEDLNWPVGVHMTIPWGEYKKLSAMSDPDERPSQRAVINSLADAANTHAIIRAALLAGATIHAHHGGGNFAPLDMSHITLRPPAEPSPENPPHRRFTVIEGDRKD